MAAHRLAPLARNSQRLLSAAALCLTCTLLLASAAPAAQGDCSQPVSNGSKPASSDCLKILKVAVGVGFCSPECICAPKGTLPTKTTDALICLKKAVDQPVTLNCPCSEPVPGGDNFNDNAKDPERWGSDRDFDGNGVLTETSGILQFTVATSTDGDYESRPWIGSNLPYDQNWEVQIDVYNYTMPTGDKYGSFGLSIFDPNNLDSEVFIELYAVGDASPSHGFYGAAYTAGEFVAEADTFGIDGLASGALRITFNATSKIITLFYDIDATDNGYSWTALGSFGLNDAGGSTGNTDWEFSDNDHFVVDVYGYAELMTVSGAKLYGDNFKVTGGVAP